MTLGNLWALMGALALAAGLALPAPAAAQSRSTSAQGKVAKAAPSQRTAKPARTAKPSRFVRAQPKQRRVVAVPPRPSVGQLAGLRATDDPLDLKSSVALVIDQESDQVLLSKNSDAVLPIASITKLMTALVIVEAGLSLDEKLAITDADIDAGRSSRSRLRIGTELTRGDLLHLALMASENRAAHALGRHYPGGLDSFVRAMNAKADGLGMHDTRYVEPTGLSSENRSSAKDLTLLVKAASQHQVIRELSTALDMQVPVGRGQVNFRNTNGLVRDPNWTIDLQKTGYIADAGRCVVMQAELYGRKLIMVLLDSAGKYSRIADAQRIREWLATVVPVAQAATPAASKP